jgi:hypothetical protein
LSSFDKKMRNQKLNKTFVTSNEIEFHSGDEYREEGIAGSQWKERIEERRGEETRLTY